MNRHHDAIRTLRSALAGILRTDLPTRLTLAAFAVLAFLYAAPAISAERRSAILASSHSDLVFLALALLAFRLDLRKVRGEAERRFWGDLSLALLCWLAGVLATVFLPGPEILREIAEDLPFAAFYVAFVLAIERQPDRPEEARTPGPTLSWPFFALFVFGLAVYFMVIPSLVSPQLYASTLPSTYLFLILDAFLAVKLIDLCRRAESLRWKAHYGLLAMVTALFFYNDVYNLPFYAANIDRSWGVPEALVWNFQYVLLVVCARLRHRSFPAAGAAPAAPDEGLAETREKTLVVALLFPAVHFAAYTFGLLDDPSKPARDATVFLWLCVIGAAALLQRRFLERHVSLLATEGDRLGAEAARRQQLTAERESLIAEVTKRNAEAEAKNLEMEQYNSTLSHELRTPLVTIRGFLGMLERDVAAGDRQRSRHSLERIRSAADRMAELLDELLELSRIGRLVNPPQTASMSDLAREAVAMTARLAGGEIEGEVQPGMPAVEGDRPRLVEAIQNLVDNAAKFIGSTPRPRIEIGWRRVGGEDVYHVRDNGIGVDRRYHGKIFDLFDRLDPSIPGTGTGLTLVKRIVELHGGRVWVESEGRGRGSTFFFTLPSASGTAT